MRTAASGSAPAADWRITGRAPGGRFRGRRRPTRSLPGWRSAQAAGGPCRLLLARLQERATGALCLPAGWGTLDRHHGAGALDCRAGPGPPSAGDPLAGSGRTVFGESGGGGISHRAEVVGDLVVAVAGGVAGRGRRVGRHPVAQQAAAAPQPPIGAGGAAAHGRTRIRAHQGIGRKAAGGRGQRRQRPLSGDYEPRNSNAFERHHRPERAARKRAGSRSRRWTWSESFDPPAMRCCGSSTTFWIFQKWRRESSNWSRRLFICGVR